MSRKIPADAFEFYVGLGEERSFERVAQRFGVSKRAITSCAGREGWTDRLAAIEQESRRLNDRKLAEAMKEARSRHLKTIRAINVRALEALKQYPVTSAMDAIRAAEIAIKLERLVAGEATERTASIEEVTRREIQDLLVVGDEEDEQEGEDETEDAPDGKEAP